MPPHGEALLDRIGEVRRALAGDIGIVLPGVRLRDDLSRDPGTYAIRVRDAIVGEGRLRLDAVLAVAEEAVLHELGGELVREPVYGMAATWIDPGRRDAATAAGALVFDPISVVGSHLAEAARAHASALLGRQELHTLLEHLRASVPSLVKEIGTDTLPLASVQRVFEALLRERVWPRDPVATLEALAVAAPHARDVRELIEAVRRTIVPGAIRRRGIGELAPLIIEPEFETELQAWLLEGTLAPHPEIAAYVRSSVAGYAQGVARERAAIVCTAALRPALWEFLARFDLRVDVFAYGELPPGLDLRPAVVLERPAAAALAQPSVTAIA